MVLSKLGDVWFTRGSMSWAKGGLSGGMNRIMIMPHKLKVWDLSLHYATGFGV